MNRAQVGSRVTSIKGKGERECVARLPVDRPLGEMFKCCNEASGHTWYAPSPTQATSELGDGDAGYAGQQLFLRRRRTANSEGPMCNMRVEEALANFVMPVG